MATSLNQIDPTTLVIAANVRLDPRLDAPFLASIRERGVLEPVIAHRTDDGTVVVEYGQRRTLAARQVGLPTIPVVVSDTSPATADRLVDQWVENEHRAALTNRERVEAVRQMALEGLTVHQIAKRTATAKATVQAAVAVAASPSAAEQADQLTLEQAVVLAEFDDDPDAQTRLLAAAQRGYGFDHTAQRLRDDRTEHAILSAAATPLTEQGLTVVEAPQWNTDPTQPLHLLTHADGTPIDPEQHAADCPGHVVWVRLAPTSHYSPTDDETEDDDPEGANFHGEDLDGDDLDSDAPSGDPEPNGDAEPGPGTGWATETVAGCAEWAEHGHRHRYTAGRQPGRKAADQMDDTEREAARAARRHVIQSNKDWAAATTVRRAWLQSFAARKNAPAGAEMYLAQVISGRRTQQVGAHELLGYTQAQVHSELTGCTPKRALHLALALALASWEQATTTDTWRQTYQADITAATLQAMQRWGYELADIETRIINGTATQIP